MPRADHINFKGKVTTRDDASTLLEKPGDLVLVERGLPRMLVMRCPCGCGDDLLINLDKRVGKAWRSYRTKKGLTLYPSYWRDSHCRSHFILWNNEIYWCYGWDDDSNESDVWRRSSPLDDAVRDCLSPIKFVDYVEIAESLEEIPWEVLRSCYRLVEKKFAEADTWPNRGKFRLLK